MKSGGIRLERKAPQTAMLSLLETCSRAGRSMAQNCSVAVFWSLQCQEMTKVIKNTSTPKKRGVETGHCLTAGLKGMLARLSAVEVNSFISSFNNSVFIPNKISEIVWRNCGEINAFSLLTQTGTTCSVHIISVCDHVTHCFYSLCFKY